MTIEVAWADDDRTIMCCTMAGAWNWADFHRHYRRAGLRYDDAGGEVDVIFDFRGGPLPAGAIGHLRSLGRPIHPNAAPRAVLVGVPDEVRERISGAGRTYQDAERTLYFAADDADAHRMIAAWRARA
ncbi:MAG: hypothetical protein HC828_18190 [Blastochloris sp.]|nr:hypothetical protein [Blastochloris sp.]